MKIKTNQVKNELGKRHLLKFTQQTMAEFQSTEFHKAYYEVLNLFAYKKIKNLMVTIPPQHGKSTGSTIQLPAFILGRNPDTKIAVGSYSSTFAKKFNRQIQRLIDKKEYHSIFPGTLLNESNVVTVSSNYLRNSEEFEIVDSLGSLKAVGRGGPLTGNAVDVMIMDDLYKDAMEGNSPVVRNAVWDWYSSVVTKRLHNDSQQLIVFTRWHEDDLIGMIQHKEEVITIKSIDEIHNLNEGFDGWIKINFEAIKVGPPTSLDKRNEGEPLYPEKHALKKLIKDRTLDPEKFECMNQGNPTSQEGLLYYPFKTYLRLPEIRERKNYTDSADSGIDYLCSINYAIPTDADDSNIYVTDILYTQKGVEFTESAMIDLLIKDNIGVADIERSPGTRLWAEAITRAVIGSCTINVFSQTHNKESRIYTNSATVNRRLIFPEDWHIKWPEFFNHVRLYKKLFKANKNDDSADALTGVIEMSNYRHFYVD